MKEHSRILPVTEGLLDRWALMEEGRKLHDKAVFELFAEMFARTFARLGLAGGGKKERRTKTRPPALTPSLAPHRAH
ncbi:MAG: hypothetical protein WHT06_09080 [Desulfobacterales bacterium]